MPICNSRTRLRRCPSSRLQCLSANWNHLNQDIWSEEKLVKYIVPFRTMVLLLSEGMLFCSSACFSLYFVSSYSLWQLSFFLLYVSQLTLQLLWPLKLLFHRFLVLASVSGFSTSLESSISVQSRETFFPLWKRLWNKRLLVFGFEYDENGIKTWSKGQRCFVVAPV